EQAHLDIRFENVCYGEDGSVRFIDFDRSMSANLKADSLYGLYRSEMHRVGNATWTAAQLDWKQFGILIGDPVQPADVSFDREHPLAPLWIEGSLRALLTCLIEQGLCL